jgi:hypothetical protein
MTTTGSDDLVLGLKRNMARGSDNSTEVSSDIRAARLVPLAC